MVVVVWCLHHAHDQHAQVGEHEARRELLRGGGVSEAVDIVSGGQSQCKSEMLGAAGSSTRGNGGARSDLASFRGSAEPPKSGQAHPDETQPPPLPGGCLVSDHAGAPPASCLSSRSSARRGQRARRSRVPPPCPRPAPAAIRVRVGVRVRVGAGVSVRARVS
eukprot:scaffold28819_cov31-Phaeocystis_antarctica.AAC.2